MGAGGVHRGTDRIGEASRSARVDLEKLAGWWRVDWQVWEEGEGGLSCPGLYTVCM